ncbi:MAG: putative Ig domain-containing protein [Smithellaceae bacterium]
MKKLNVLLAMFFLMVVMGCSGGNNAPSWFGLQTLSITSPNNTTFTEGTAGTFTFTATGTPTPIIALTGPLPSGVTFNAATGVLSGTPALGTSGTYPLTVTASSGFFSVTQNFTLTVAPGQTFGVVALSNVANIGILNGSTQTVTILNLSGQLGTVGGGLFDVVISPDGKTTLVSNFGDSKVFFIDTSNPAAPVVSGSVETTFFAEDMAITPDGRYALVTDGGFSSKIAVIDVVNRTLVEVFESAEDTTDPLNPWTPQHQAVAVAPDGKTVLTADYWNQKVHVHTISAAGHLTYVSSIDVSNQVLNPDTSEYVKTLRPVNIDISPDGQTVIVASIGGGYVDAAETIKVNLAFPVLTITGPGQVTLTDMANVGPDLNGSQSIAFNHDGTKAYLHCTQRYIAPDPEPDPPVYPDNVIVALNITAVGKASDAGTRIVVEGFGTSQLFGVDTLAMDNPGKYLYVSNPTLMGGSGHIKVVDVTTNTVVKTITFDPVGPSEPTLPTGISFWHP